jgi:hypothetical protein
MSATQVHQSAPIPGAPRTALFFDPVLRSAILLAAISGLGSYWYDNPSFAIPLALGALVHVRGVGTRSLSWARFLVIHALLTAALVISVLIYVQLSVGVSTGWQSEALETLRISWTQGAAPSLFVRYSALRLLAFCGLAAVAVRMLGKRTISTESIGQVTVALAVAQAPIEYVLREPLSTVGVLSLEGSQDFVFAAGVLGLEFAVPFILLTSLLYMAARLTAEVLRKSRRPR